VATGEQIVATQEDRVNRWVFDRGVEVIHGEDFHCAVPALLPLA
jgi:hypothetical protein